MQAVLAQGLHGLEDDSDGPLAYFLGVEFLHGDAVVGQNRGVLGRDAREEIKECGT